MLKKIHFTLLIFIIVNFCLATDYYQQFVRAVSLKDENTIDKILASGLNTANTNNETILMYSIANDQDEIANNLLDNGASPNIRTNTGKTALMIAVLKNNKKIINKLMDKGADINIQDNNGINALMYAIKTNNSDLIKVFLNKASCNINLTDHNGLTALEWAAIYSNKNDLSLLYEKAPENNKSNSQGLLQAVLNDNTEAVEFFVNKEVNIYFKNRDNQTILDLSVESSNPKIIKMLYKKAGSNVSVNYLDKVLVKSIQYYNNDKSLFNDLSKIHFFDINKNYKHTPFYIKNIINEIKTNNNFKKKCLEIVSINIDEFSPSNISINCTLLDIALLNNSSIDLIEKLIDSGTSLNRENKALEATPLALALRFSDLETIKYLQTKGANKLGNSFIINELKKSYYIKSIFDNNLNSKIKDKKFINFYSSLRKFGPFYITLQEFDEIANSFNIKIDENKLFQDSLLYYSFYVGNLEMLINLKNQNIDLNKSDPLGQTGFTYASFSTGQPFISRYQPAATIKHLLENNYLEYHQSFSNLTPVDLTLLMIVALHNNPEITKLLIQNGINTKIKSPQGFTALHYAEISEKSLFSNLKNLKKYDLIGFYNIIFSLEKNKQTQEILKNLKT